MDIPENYKYLFKFLIIGAAGSGKTCILRRYTEGKFIHNMPHTIGAEFGSKIINVDGTTVKIQIWDTAGQERFRSMARSYYHDAVGALLVYDVTNRDSFNDLGYWLSDARTLASPDIIIVLVGNKKDLQDTDGQVTQWEASAFAQDNDLHFLETSALTGENVEEAFTECVRSLVFKIKNGELDPDRLKCNRQLPSLTFVGRPQLNSMPQVRVQDDSTLSYECNC
ncbi:putative Ras-related protein Rab-4A [Schistosoma japonicum]|nr:putative Ras-related protein Rab-4A [Schistosoma japonicum]KAH8872596.1 putative Ras-related protein Rab-4A [Schistosoma japonicum]KAH8872597.1 putative Ras-related protein Rab-4A [Schistosoma japonicum]KAH8872598.1 putative Ras-related protein Rab-4A [Schistosoma japonicum]